MGIKDALGITVGQSGEEEASVKMELSNQNTNPGGGAHGGALATLADIAMAIALRNDGLEHRRQTTVEMKVNYLRPAARGPLVATGKVVHRGKTLAVLHADIADADGNLVATALGTFMMMD